MNEAARRWLAEAIGSDPIDEPIPLEGSTSASLYRVEASIGSRRARYVLRVFTMSQWLAQEPDLLEHEAAVLRVAELNALPAPRLVACAERHVGFGAPAILMTFVDGAVDLRPKRMDAWLRAQADMLARIHASSPGSLQWRYKSWTDAAALRVPAWSRRTALWQRAFDLRNRGAPHAREVLLHRDFHPVNVLWRNDALSGVVDWVNGCRGPAGVDVAHCRLNLALMHGPDVADAFARAYAERGIADFDDPHWDVDCVLGALPDPAYYAPWRRFGLGEIPQTLLRERLEQHLARIVARG